MPIPTWSVYANIFNVFSHIMDEPLILLSLSNPVFKKKRHSLFCSLLITDFYFLLSTYHLVQLRYLLPLFYWNKPWAGGTAVHNCILSTQAQCLMCLINTFLEWMNSCKPQPKVRDVSSHLSLSLSVFFFSFVLVILIHSVWKDRCLLHPSGPSLMTRWLRVRISERNLRASTAQEKGLWAVQGNDPFIPTLPSVSCTMLGHQLYSFRPNVCVCVFLLNEWNWQIKILATLLWIVSGKGSWV